MLVTTKLDNCKGCKDLHSLIDELDCVIASTGEIVLNNIRYALSVPVNNNRISKAITLKRILTARTYNPSYAECDISGIINLVKQYTYGL